MNFKLIAVSTTLLFYSVVNAIAQKIDTNKVDTNKINYLKPLFDFNYNKPLFDLQQEQLNNKNKFLRFNALTGYREGVDPIRGMVNFESDIDNVHGTVRLYWLNLSILEIINMGHFKSNRIILEVKDPSKYKYDESMGSKLKWERSNKYCLELLYPIGIINSGMLDNELFSIFGLRFGREKRSITTLVLIRTSNSDKIRSKGKGKSFFNVNGHFNNTAINNLSIPLEEAEMPPMIDETGYKERIDLELNIKSWKDIPEIRKQLNRYDLDLIYAKRPVEVFVVTEN